MKTNTEHSNTEFISDIFVPNMLYGMLLRSPIRKGRLLDIIIPKLPDGYFFYSAIDIPGKNSIYLDSGLIPIFGSFELTYAGQPIGILVGPDIPTVEKLLHEFRIETEKETPFEFHKSFSEKQILCKKNYNKGNIDLFYNDEESFSVTEQTYNTPITDSFCLESQAVLTLPPDNIDNHYRIYAPTQWPSHLRKTLAKVLDIDEESFHVFSTAMSEPQDNNLIFPSLLAAEAVIASFLSGFPVKLILSRKETLLYGPKTPPATIRHRTITRTDGIIVGMDIRIFLNVGSASPLIEDIINRMLITCTGFYFAETLHIEIYAIKTNMPPFLGYKGWGDTEVFFALETHMNYVASKKNIPPVEFKLLNMIDFSKDFLTEAKNKQKNFCPELFEKAMLMSDFSRKYTSFQYMAKKRKDFDDGPLKGIGIAVGYQGSGGLKIFAEQSYSIQATMEKDTSLHFVMNQTSKDMESIWRDIAAKTLEIDPSTITFEVSDQEELLKNGPSIQSVHVTQLTRLVELCCNSIQKQRFRNPLPIVVKKNSKNPKRAWNSESREGIPFSCMSSAVAVVEIEIDRVNYSIKIRDVWFVVDAGDVYSEHAVRRTISKGIHRGLSLALVEQHDKHFGKISSDFYPAYSLLDFTVYPNPKVEIFESKSTPKGIENLPISLIPSALASAVSQALNMSISTIPITPLSLFKVFDTSSEKN